MRLAAFALAALLAALGLAAWGGVFSPSLDWLTHFAPMGLAGSVLAALLWRIGQKRSFRPTAALLIIAVLAWGGLMAPELVRALLAQRGAKGQETFKIVQFNLLADDPAASQKAAWLLRTDADLIVMEEVAKPAIPLLAALARVYPYKLTCEKKPYPCPVTILSKRPPIAEGHFSGGGPKQANTAWGRFMGPGGAYDVVAVHIDRARPKALQHMQFATLTRQLSGFDSPNLILAGDFNSTPWSFVLRRFDRQSGLVRRTRVLPTWPAGTVTTRRIWSPFPVLPIDHVYAGAAWRTVKVERGPRLGSDHYPVVVTLVRGP